MRIVGPECRLDESDVSESGLRKAGVGRDGGVNLGACVNGDVTGFCDVAARLRGSEFEDMLWCDAVPGATNSEVSDACGCAETDH